MLQVSLVWISLSRHYRVYLCTSLVSLSRHNFVLCHCHVEFATLPADCTLYIVVAGALNACSLICQLVVGTRTALAQYYDSALLPSLLMLFLPFHHRCLVCTRKMSAHSCPRDSCHTFSWHDLCAAWFVSSMRPCKSVPVPTTAEWLMYSSSFSPEISSSFSGHAAPKVTGSWWQTSGSFTINFVFTSI